MANGISNSPPPHSINKITPPKESKGRMSKLVFYLVFIFVGLPWMGFFGYLLMNKGLSGLTKFQGIVLLSLIPLVLLICGLFVRRRSDLR
jgi:hypothetical protein